jgi:hypothetical protein
MVVGMGVQWPLPGGGSGRFDGGLFCQLRVCEQVSKLEE